MSSNNSTVITTVHGSDSSFVLSEEVRIFLLTLILAVAFLGIVANVINIMVFYKLQSGDPININLLGLSVSDFAVCLTTFIFMILTAQWFNKFMYLNWKISPVEVFYMTIGVPHTIFVRITVLLTAQISLERCLCVVKPLEVKMILTSERVTVSVAVSYLVCGLLFIPIYNVSRLEWVHEPFLNMSILRHVKTNEFFDLNYWFTPLEGVCLHVIPFLVVTVCTVVMIKSLKKRIAFRQAATRTNSNEIAYSRDKKIAVMVVSMSTVFLICNLPNIILFLLVAFDPSLVSLRESSTSDLVQIIGYVPLLLDTINSAINIFIYHSNSSNYKTVFNRLFRLPNV